MPGRVAGVDTHGAGPGAGRGELVLLMPVVHGSRCFGNQFGSGFADRVCGPINDLEPICFEKHQIQLNLNILICRSLLAKETQIKNEVKRIKSDQIFVPQKSKICLQPRINLSKLFPRLFF